MKRLLLYIGIAAAILGCTKSEELSTSAADGAISFSAGEIATRVTDGGTTLSWDSGEQINITDGTKSGFYTISDTSTGAMKFYSGDEFYTYGDQTQTFYGWSPSTLTAVEGKLSLDLSNQTSVSQVVVGSASTATTTATFAFAPIYTKVVFNLTAGGADVTDLSTATATLSGANVKGDYDYVAGTFSDLAASDITPTVVVDSEDSSKATITAYILETTSMSGELTISVGSDSFVSSLAGKSWAKGDMYEYNVTVGDEATWSGSIATAFESGDGTSAENPFIIANGEQLAYLAQEVNKGTTYSGYYFELASDINLNNKEWTPIGYFQSLNFYADFSGTFDGAGYEISGLYINYSADTKLQALFGHTTGTIKNLGVSGSVTSTTSGAAGVVGCVSYGSIENCYNKATVSSAGNTGGVVAYAYWISSVSNCYNTGRVEGNGDVGGVVGISSSSYVSNCYNTGSVSGSGNVGGIVGFSDGYTVNNCYWLDTAFSGDGVGVTIDSVSIENVESKSESEMTGGSFASTLGSAFKEDYSTPINNGYPILSWQ